MADTMRATAHEGQIVNLRMRAGLVVEFNEFAWKGRDLLNCTMGLALLEVCRTAHDESAWRVLVSRLALEPEVIPLEKVGTGQRHQAAGPHTELVLENNPTGSGS